MTNRSAKAQRAFGLLLAAWFSLAETDHEAIAAPPSKKAAPTSTFASNQDARAFSGVYPQLAFFNRETECGVGALAPWADRLWAVTYAPHQPKGSSDKLYELTAALDRTTRPESIGGTPANRMIHRESRQLFIGPYAIDAQRRVRVIPYETMFGRLTGNARHLTDPARKIYCATMEEGFYEIDVKTLDVVELWRDEQKRGGRKADLPGYHGKGFYSGQGRVIYANNGQHGPEALRRPDIPSGALAQWDGKADSWTVVRRNQFTEVTGPGGVYGNADPDNDPVWSVGWDHRSLILMLLDHGRWQAFRLPKATHTYDGAHGWNTEWPRIRDIGQNDLLMTMHGMFWRFPRNFRDGRTAGVAPRSTYLKVIGDFCRWNDRLVFGCDDAAKSAFLNKNKIKGPLPGPAQSQSNLWFAAPEQLDRLGPPLGRGAVWVDDAVQAGEPSEPYLFQGFDRRGVHLAHNARRTVAFQLEVDRRGDGRWTPLRRVAVGERGYRFVEFSPEEAGAWVRLRTDADCRATAWFEYRNRDKRSATPDPRFEGLAQADTPRPQGALLRAGEEKVGLQVLAAEPDEKSDRPRGYYELGPDLELRRMDSPDRATWMAQHAAVRRDVFSLEGTSVLYVDEQGHRFRLPVGNPAYLEHPELLNRQRPGREVCTERDIVHCAGSFFELPARNAGGFPKIRPIATHPYFIHDFCSWRGLLVLSGIPPDAGARNSHVVRSDDGRCALWLGAVDDLWALGKAVGRGGPWEDTPVLAGQPSDPFLMAGYDRKKLTLSHKAAESVRVKVQIDITGTGRWRTHRTLDVPAGRTLTYDFPDAFGAYWVRFVSSADTVATAQLEYR